MNNKKTGKVNKLLFTLPTIITAITVTPVIAILGTNANANNIKESNISADVNNPNQQAAKPLVPSVSNMFNPKLSSKNGPIVFWNDKITSLDWFGAERWSIDVTQINIENKYPFKENGSNGTTWNRHWLNFDLDKTRDILYVLSNAKQGAYQYAVSINVQNGTVTNLYQTAQVSSGDLSQTSFFMLKVLNNGNLAFLGKPGHIGDGNTDVMDVVDIKTKQVTRYDGNITEDIAPRPVADASQNPSHNYTRSYNSIFNLIPIGPNRNLLAIFNLTSKSGSTGDNGATNGTSDVWFILVDDHFNTISTATNGWNKAKFVTAAITNTKNSRTKPQSDYHVLLDGRVVTVIYDKLIVIDPTDLNNPTLAISPLQQDKWIESWSFDSNETLFFKEKNGTEIKQVQLDPNKSNWQSPHHTISPYYNLSDSPVPEIKTTASSLVLYNVYGYIGQIMLINSQFQEVITPNAHANEQQIQEKKYGLAVAITNNKNTTGQGDTKGLLNTENAFQRSADFNIEASLLQSKLPSEITRNDLTFLNESFLTQNTSKKPDGTLLYEPFVKNIVDDITKQLQVTLHLDQIPWFVTNGKMPNNIVPLKITKTYTSGVDISKRFGWKDVDIEDYDFKNTLPSKLTIDDVVRVNPLVSTLASQQATINGQSYPKTTYTFGTKNDSTGQVTLNARYEYLPMELKADPANIKSYSTSKEYTIFNSNMSKAINFVGDGKTDVGTIPELKEIKESNILPSSFNNASQQEYLRFINVNSSKGYPLSKMDITATANDSTGTLTIRIDPKRYDNTLSVVTQTFTGLNKTASYSLKFSEGTGLNKKLYLPSEVNEELFYKHFVTFSGFDSSDFDLQLYPNDLNGSLVTNITLTGDYPNGPTTGTDFKLQNGVWVAQKTFTGFKNLDDFNKEYQVVFKKDGDPSLAELQKLTPSEIQNKLTNNTLTINNVKITSKEQLIDLFIASKGGKIPTTIVNNKDVEVEMFINNGNGEITWRLTYKNLAGYPNPITFLETITGFARGNQVATPDVLTFANSSQLKAKYPNYFNMLPSQVKAQLEANPSKVNDFFLNPPTGGYQTAISQNKYKLTIIADDNTGKLNIKITFNKDPNLGINSSSLLEYNQVYENLMFH